MKNREKPHFLLRVLKGINPQGHHNILVTADGQALVNSPFYDSKGLQAKGKLDLAPEPHHRAHSAKEVMERFLQDKEFTYPFGIQDVVYAPGQPLKLIEVQVIPSGHSKPSSFESAPPLLDGPEPTDVLKNKEQALQIGASTLELLSIQDGISHTRTLMGLSFFLQWSASLGFVPTPHPPDEFSKWLEADPPKRATFPRPVHPLFEQWLQADALERSDTPPSREPTHEQLQEWYFNEWKINVQSSFSDTIRRFSDLPPPRPKRAGAGMTFYADAPPIQKKDTSANDDPQVPFDQSGLVAAAEGCRVFISLREGSGSLKDSVTYEHIQAFIQSWNKHQSGTDSTAGDVIMRQMDLWHTPSLALLEIKAETN